MQGAVGIYLVALQPGSGEREVADMQKKIKPDNKYKKKRQDRTGVADFGVSMGQDGDNTEMGAYCFFRASFGA